MISAFIGLGSNMGNPPQQLAAARQALTVLPAVHMAAVSPIYRSEPQGNRDQPWFHNQVVRLDCGPQWSAPVLLNSLLAIENTQGRQRTGNARFAPRRIDLDLLLFGMELCKDTHLCLPHPRMFERAFVLIPLQDIAPDLVFPDGRDPQRCLETLTYRLQADCIYQ